MSYVKINETIKEIVRPQEDSRRAQEVSRRPQEVRQVGKFTKTVMGSGNISFSTAKAKAG